MGDTPDRQFAEVAGGSGQASGTPDLVVDTELPPGGGVLAFNGRSGTVAPQQSDYDAFFLTPAEGNAAYAASSEPIAAAHIVDAGDAHDASAVSFVAGGSIAATDVQTAIAEVATDYIAADSAHVAAADPHPYVLESLFDTKGDLIAASADNTPAKLTAGANSTILVADSAQTAGLKYSTLVLPHVHTWAIAGEIKVPVTDTDFIVPMFMFVPTGWTAVVSRCRYVINAGTSVTAKLQKNGSDLTGFTGISVTTTAATTDPADQAIADTDKLALVVTAVAGTPLNMSFSVEVRLTFAG